MRRRFAGVLPYLQARLDETPFMMAHTVFGQFWPPMHQRAVLAAGGGTLTDTLHLA